VRYRLPAPPGQTLSFKLSREPHFVEKPRVGVGLYLNPPEHARVLLAGREEPDSGPRC